ncbi:MAG: hypothetical protein WA982_13640 [Rubrobacteraceae bacterium]
MDSVVAGFCGEVVEVAGGAEVEVTPVVVFGSGDSAVEAVSVTETVPQPVIANNATTSATFE